jgi:hypothetical protein
MSCHCHSDIVRDGSGQLGRYLKALDPAYAPIDERSMEELLVFIKRYAAQIRFYDIPESNPGGAIPPAKTNWREFFSRDMAVIAAGIATTDIAQIRKDFDETFRNLQEDPEADIYAALFSPVLGMAARIDRWYSLAIPENPLYETLTLAIQSELKAQLQKVTAYEEGFKLVDPGKTLNLDYTAIKNKSVWGLDEPVVAEGSIYQGADEAAKIRYAALYVEDVFLSFYGFLQKLTTESSQYFTYALEQYPAHQPHMALFIAFLKLFKLAQEQMNGITERMLNFYYREVLQLTEKKSIPDRVHIVFELAKDVTDYAIAPGTALSAGKDASGKEQVYKTESDLVVNQAKVKELKTIFIEKKLENDMNVIGSISAQPIANSLDGYGEKFTDAYPKWPTFGRQFNRIRNPKNICQLIDLAYDRLYARNEAAIGFAIASPQLLLQGGNRLIVYRLEGLDKIYIAGSNPTEQNVRIKFTAAKEWITIDQRMSDELRKSLPLDDSTIFDIPLQTQGTYYIDEGSLIIYLPASVPSIIPFDSAMHDGAFVTSHPVMQVLLGPDVMISEDDFSNLGFRNASLEVRVGSMSNVTDPQQDGIPFFDGLKTLTLQNDDGILDASKAFDPFTAYPNRGKSLYIGSAEVFNKTLDELSLHIRLANPVEDIIIGRRAAANSPYILTVRESRAWSDVLDIDTMINIEDLAKNVLALDGGGKRILNRYPVLPEQEYTSNTIKGFLQLEYNIQILASDKGVYERMQEEAQHLKVKEISVSYHSTLARLEAGTDQFFQVYPFGVLEADLTVQNTRARVLLNDAAGAFTTSSKTLQQRNDRDLLVDTKDKLFPQFTYLNPYAKYTSIDITPGTADPKSNYPVITSTIHNANSTASRKLTAIDRLMIDASGVTEKLEGAANQYSGLLQEEGMLFIGIENLKPLQSLSLLFQLAEGSAEDEDNDPPAIHWSYLINNEWRPLKGENIVADDTFGFQTTGIVKIDVPADINSNNTIMTTGLYWFCASVTEHSNRIPKLVDIVAQAVIAKFEDQNNDQTHFDNALAAGSISKLTVKVAEVSKVIQPFASWDGKHRETGKEFYTRVSERLRHKARAINVWDYEHLILDRFPTIYKVKAIPHVDPECLCRHTDLDSPYNTARVDDCCGPQIAPGHVLIVPISNFKNRNAVNPLQPKTSRRTLLEIESYIKKRTSPFVKVHAKNPVYEQILVFFRVKFYTGIDKGYYLKKLNEDIVHFLTPWAFDETADVVFGQKIYASSIINFIEERPYVDFITDFIMGVCKDECCTEDIRPIPQDQSVPTQSPEGRPIITGVIYDSTSNLPLPGVTVQIKGMTESTVTDASGAFTLRPTTTDDVVLTIAFIGYTFKEVNTPVNRSWKIYILQELSGTNDSDTDKGLIETLSSLCGCSDFEHLLQHDSDFIGEVVAQPSTPRSILVSAARHIIIPYEEKPRQTPCEKLQESRRASTVKPLRTNPNVTRAADASILARREERAKNVRSLSTGKSTEKRYIPAKKKSGRSKKSNK